MKQQQTPKKRGRPPITKNYANPLESPMAHSSMKVQKQGTQNFTKPLMKVGQLTPTQRKRRQSNVSLSRSNNSSPTKEVFLASSPSLNSASLSSTASVLSTKKGRYRGILLSTPVRNVGSRSGSNCRSNYSTPSGKANLKSSPPAGPITPLTGTNLDTNIRSTMKTGVDHITEFNFSLSLNINRNGKATIGSSPVSYSALDIQYDHVDRDAYSSPIKNTKTHKFEKNEVMVLLRKMKNDVVTRVDVQPNAQKQHTQNNLVDNKHDSDDDMMPRKLERAFSHIPEQIATDSNNVSTPKVQPSVQLTVPKTPPPPTAMSPSNFFNFQMKTGFTPAFNAGAVGFFSPLRVNFNTQVPPAPPSTSTNSRLIIPNSAGSKTGMANEPGTIKEDPKLTAARNKMLQNDFQKQFVFKYSVGDPLLLTDDPVLDEQTWQDTLNVKPNHISPGRPVCFNTPPSFLNLASPGALLFSPPSQGRNSSSLVSTNVKTNEHENQIMNMLKHHQELINSSGKLNDISNKSPNLNNILSPELRGNINSIDGKLYGNDQSITKNLINSIEKENIGSDINMSYNSSKVNSIAPPNSLNGGNKCITNNDIPINYNNEVRYDSLPKTCNKDSDTTYINNDIINPYIEKSDDARIALKNLIREGFSEEN